MFKCVGCAQHNKTRWARPDSNVMPWATGNNVQVRGLCTTQQDTMGPARQQCHAMGHRQQCSSAWAVHNTRRHDGPSPTSMSCHGPQATMFKCVGCAQHNQTRWARPDSNVMPWATDNNVQLHGLCTTKPDTMGPTRQHRRAPCCPRRCAGATSGQIQDCPSHPRNQAQTCPGAS